MPRRRTTLALCIALFATALSFAKSNLGIWDNGHAGDMCKVLGLNLENSFVVQKAKLLTDTEKGFARWIDSQEDCSELLGKIRRIAPAFSEGQWRHRIFFHWGFHGDPKDVAPLKRQIELASEDPEIQRRVWNEILDAQSHRNREMRKLVEDAAAMAPNVRSELRPEEKEFLAALLYDTHILGDYIEGELSTQDALLNLDDLKADIVRAVREIVEVNREAFPDQLSSKEFQQFQTEIDKASRLGDNQQKAGNILKAMIEKVPPILKKCRRIKKAFVLN